MGGEDKFDFLRVQSAALPTELPGHINSHDKTVKKRNYSKNADFYRVLRPFSQWSGAVDCQRGIALYKPHLKNK